MGDSLAAGFGATDAKHTLGARLARGVARHTKRSVTLRTVAVVGDETSMLTAQLDRLPAGYVPDLAVIVIGSNDIASRTSTAESVAHLAGAVRRLRALGAEVVVGTCPDMGMAPAIPQPLRSMGGRASRRLAAAQAKAVTAAGGHPVATGHGLRTLFLAHPERMFSDDRFHPSSLGYRRSAKAMLPAVLAAVDAAVPEFA
ncbi:SGNH/GDSL hydrolase family protein [Paenarthrobacter sp. Z7-10]|uniref:SGNH/GDSL hydrolase family protein n=1 Tax=Paenarthrobacter sp. Z7-10 TaxID=2787635 RepID=UPI0022A8D3C9|nr:SGNH/GDSL hydrolase family protein [Paenarthrobacter sp. Z7-10]MCZ2403570.1 SGNH/GDSL hydrolase family protein [Paenarthrobacter sp. Z7-10]